MVSSVLTRRFFSVDVFLSFLSADVRWRGVDGEVRKTSLNRADHPWLSVEVERRAIQKNPRKRTARINITRQRQPAKKCAPWAMSIMQNQKDSETILGCVTDHGLQCFKNKVVLQQEFSCPLTSK